MRNRNITFGQILVLLGILLFVSLIVMEVVAFDHSISEIAGKIAIAIVSGCIVVLVTTLARQWQRRSRN